MSEAAASSGSKRPRHVIDSASSSGTLCTIARIQASAVSPLALAAVDGEVVRLHVPDVELHIGTTACGSGALFVTTA